MPIESMLAGLMPADNPYFSAGAGLAVLGIGLSVLKRGSAVAATVAQRQLLVTLEVTSRDRSYPWVLNWLTGTATNTQHLSVETNVVKKTNGGTETTFDYVPCPGRHFLWYNGRPVAVERTREKQMYDLSSGSPFETVKLVTVGRDFSFFEEFLNEAREKAESKEEGKTIVYTHWGTEWRPFGNPRARRPISSVILDKGLGERIVGDVREFVGSADWYHSRGIPYRRGYLLHGPPGSGKSSFIMALAGELKYNICILNLAEKGLTDDRLAHALSQLPQPSLVLLEDVDAAFTARKANDGFPVSVTFSGLLNTLDGVASGEERIVFMTTNHIDKLDPALLRPGRVDVVLELGDASEHQIAQMYANFYPEAKDKANVFAASLNGVTISMAQLQGYLMTFKNSPMAALAHASELKAAVESSRGMGVNVDVDASADRQETSTSAAVDTQRAVEGVEGGDRTAVKSSA